MAYAVSVRPAITMLREYQRQLTEDKRERLESMLASRSGGLRDALKSTAIWATGFVVLGGTFVFLAESDGDLVVALLVLVALGAFACFLIMAMGMQSVFEEIHGRRYWRQHDLDLPKLLRHGRVTVRHVKASAVIYLQADEDEGDGYLFEIGEGRSLLLNGEWSEFLDNDGPWPSDEFEVVESPDEHLIGFYSIGKPLEPAKTVPLSELDADVMGEIVDKVYDISPDNVLSQLRATGEPEAMRPEYYERGFFFWALCPFLLLFIVVMPWVGPKQDVTGMIVLISVETLAVLVLLGLFNSVRFWWAWRGVAAIIFATYMAYLIATLIESGGVIAFEPRKSKPSAFNAICGMIVFGIPGLMYALFGRLTLRKEESDDKCD